MPKGGNGGGKSGGGGGKPGGGGDSEWNQVNGNKRDNELFGADGIKNVILGKDGNDILHGGDLEDLLIGGDGDDILYGNDGPDRLYGGNGNDELYGGAGSDQLQGGAGADVMDGGGPASVEDPEDHDVAMFVEINHGLTIEPYTGTGSFDYMTSDGDEIVRVEEIVGTNYDDIMIGGDGDDYYVGARGEDTLIGNAGNDTLYGSLDDDVIYAGEDGGSGSDTLIFLRYNTDGDDETLDAFPLGDGHDVVWDFDVGSDTIVFLVNEPFTPTAELVTDALATTDIIEPDGTLITYATDSTILLVGVFDASLATVDIQFETIVI